MKFVSGFQLPSGCCWPASQCSRALNQPRVDVGDLRHIVELHQAVGRKDLVGGRLAEPREATARDLERQQSLVAVGDVSLRLGVDFGRQLLRALHVVEREHVGVGARRGLLEAAAGHAQDAVHALDDLAERARIEADEELVASGIDVRGKVQVVLHAGFEAAVEDEVLLASVGDDFDFAHHDVVARSRHHTIHARGQR